MGRKRKGNAVDGVKPKKHKKNKHRHHPSEDVEIEPLGIDRKEEIARPIKLKIKLGDQLISSSEATIGEPLDDTSSPADSEPQSLMGGTYGSSTGGGAEGGSSLGIPDQEEDIIGSDVSVGKDEYVGSGEEEEEEEEEVEEGQEVEEGDHEEEAWLDALEAGEVNERGYLPQIKDSSSLTARQRAMLGEDGESGELMELPVGRSSEQLTEEMLLKKTEKNRKRRLAAQKRKEKRKAETVRKLLEKQCTKKKDDEKPKVVKKAGAARITYINRLDEEGRLGITLSLPPGMDFPIKAEKLTTPPPAVTLCAVEGCHNPKKYSDSVTKLPLCSLQCYRTVHSTVKTLSPPSLA